MCEKNAKLPFYGMLKIKDRTVKRDGRDATLLVINGKLVEDSYTSNHAGFGRWATIYDKSAANILLAHRFKELEPHFSTLSLPFTQEWNELFSEVEIVFRDYRGGKNKKVRKLKFEFRTNFEVWARPYSMIDYSEAIRQAAKDKPDLGLKFYHDDEIALQGSGLECRVNSLAAVVKDEIADWIPKLKVVSEDALAILSKAARKNSVVTFFDFPPPMRTACEQYLLYFVQFLEDLGISANAEIKEDARRVLFSVTPTDGPSALLQVRQALEVYLQLPGMPDFGASANQFPNLAVQQLHGNVLHLQSQLALAKATLQAQDATIEMLRLSSFQYRQLLDRPQKAEEKSEPLVGDTVHVTKIEGKGLKVDLPLILQRLKRVFGVGSKKSD